MLLTSSVLSTTSKLCFEQPATSFLVCSLIFIEYYFEDRVKSLPDDISKREYARRLLHDINLLVQDNIVKQWIQDNYPKFNYHEDSLLVKFLQKLGLLIDDEISK